jgi:acetyl-CoA synthetase
LLRVLEVGPELDARLNNTEPYRGSVAVGASGTLVQLYTSGTTGTPKAVPVPVRALTSICSYMVHGLDVTDDDIFWNAADPGWAYGLYYAVLGPLATGKPNILAAGGFNAEGTRAVIDRLGVTSFASAPTVYRSLRQADVTLDRPLRRASSAGEPLTPDVSEWAQNALGVDVRDHYGQTEQGMVIGNAWHPDVSRPVHPGSMGRALPGFTATILNGRIALDISASPLMWFTGYVEAPEKTAERFTDDRAYYLTGDTGREEDGNYYFAARDDDIILMAGYRIGPTDIETVLNRHPAVVESAVVGRPDNVRGEVAVAFVVLVELEAGTPELATELQHLVKTTYAAHAYPRAVHFIDALPKTPSGKLQRAVLRRS